MITYENEYQKEQEKILHLLEKLHSVIRINSYQIALNHESNTAQHLRAVNVRLTEIEIKFTKIIYWINQDSAVQIHAYCTDVISLIDEIQSASIEIEKSISAAGFDLDAIYEIVFEVESKLPRFALAA